MTTGAEEVGWEDSEIWSLINGRGCSLWQETGTHAAAEAAHIREPSLTPFPPLDKAAKEDCVVT
jgi:hypothetical protein